MENKSEEELMRLIYEGYRPALEELYDRYIKLVYSFAFKSTKDHEKTRLIVQAVFTRLWTTKNGFDPVKGQFVNWLLTITRNITIDHHRKEKKDHPLVSLKLEHWERVADDPAKNPENIFSRKVRQEQIKKASQFLSTNQIELIQWLYWEGYSLREISEIKKEPIGTIKSRLHQTLKILRKHLISEMEEV